MSRPRGQLLAGLGALASLIAMLATATLVLVPNLRPSLGSDQAADGTTQAASPNAGGESAANPSPSAPRPSPQPLRPCRATAKGSTPGKPTGTREGPVRVINVGYEDVVNDDPQRLKELATQLDAMGATGVRIAVGRMDWVTFPWAGRPSAQSGDVVDTGRDYVGEAIEALRCDQHGMARNVYLGIDVLFGREFEKNPQWAGVNQTGDRSDLFASVSAWKEGQLTTLLADLAREVATRYQPDAVNITELLFDLDTFGPRDLADFRKTTGLRDWPRNAKGKVDVSDRRVQKWRTDALVSVVKAVKKRIAPTGVDLTMDVRIPVEPTRKGRPDLGQDYPKLLEHVDRLVLWDFPGMTSTGVFRAKDLGPLLLSRYPDRFELEVGVWRDSKGVIGDEVVAKEVSEAEAAGFGVILVTPASLLNPATRAALEQEWGPAKKP